MHGELIAYTIQLLHASVMPIERLLKQERVILFKVAHHLKEKLIRSYLVLNMVIMSVVMTRRREYGPTFRSWVLQT